MKLIDEFFTIPIAAGVSALIFFVIGLFLKKEQGRGWLLALSLFLYIRYMVWRVFYTIPTDDVSSMIVGWIVYLAELYGLCQFCFFAYQSWSLTDRQPAPITTYPTVDIMVTVVDEPLPLLRQTVVGCLSQEYPKAQYKVHILDDGHRIEAKKLAASLGCGYIRRPNHLRHARAESLNHALHLTDGDLVAVFDVGHIPARTFLKETVGFFEDAKVAIVQTPHHFYNPDIFQRNLRVGDLVKNEHALFFRSLQAGRDAHNSAVFAGSSGLFRRKPLEENGGFQTQTVAEDIHTSMNLHAEGYKSMYLNRVLSAGLMPETFERYLKQRTRWAIGCIQVLLYDNPLTKHGLTFSQRLDYFGSIFYAFFGLPRFICLIAPLSSLLFHTPPIHADVMLFGLHFFSFYIASALVMRPVSRGSRNPFWSDIYELSVCFALSAVIVKALLVPWKKQAFSQMPRGQGVKKNTSSELTLTWPHLLTFGLLIGGLVLGIQDLRHGTGDSGLPVSLLWGLAILLPLTIAIFVANEQPQSRLAFRVNRDFASELFVDDASVAGRILNINEHGVALSLESPVFTAQSTVRLLLTSSRGTLVRLTGRIMRQKRLRSGEVEAGLQFVDLDDSTRQVLIDKIFGDPTPWEESYQFKPGVTSSLGSLLYALAAPWRSFTWERRRMPRVPHETSCRLNTSRSLLCGKLEDMSFKGVSVFFRSTPKESLAGSFLELPRITLKVSPVLMRRCVRKTHVRFRVESIERGEQDWKKLHDHQWRRS